MSVFIQQFINFLQLGSIYALTAISFSMVYGIAGLVNFAHGSIFTVSMYMLFFFSTYLFTVFDSSWLVFAVALVLGSVVMALVGMLIERLAYRPLRSAPAVATVVSSVGVGMALEYLMLNLFGSKAKRMPALIPNTSITMAGVVVPLYKILIIIFAVITMIILSFIVKKTKLGTAMRAVAQDKKAAGFMGINTNRVITSAFVFGAVLATIAAILYVSAYSIFTYDVGDSINWWSFIAAVIGGIGSIEGAVLGGFIIGAISIVAPALLPVSSYKDIVLFAVLILVLMVKPTGILGKNSAEKI
ncbi:MAG: branched-chain amino acid ABC transporter permease [Lachnospiraceae bacterium]|nr:branched-chain amino acid ABC transporter permease [Lachnospiraceae bacterium]